VDLRNVPDGWMAYTQLASTALAVVVRRVDGWCVYVKGVAGNDHDQEAQEVLLNGDKLDEGTAKAILAHRFHPPLSAEGLAYAH